MNEYKCPTCGQYYHDSAACPKCKKCHPCCMCDDLFDADELGLDPETDNTPNHLARSA